MAQYTIITTREQEAGLNYSFTNYAAEGQTKAQFLQERVNQMVLNPMFIDFKGAQAMSLDKSVATIPEANEAKAKQELEAVIISNGGTIVPVGPPPSPIPTGHAGGTLSATRGTSGNPIQVGGRAKKDAESSGPDGTSDK